MINHLVHFYQLIVNEYFYIPNKMPNLGTLLKSTPISLGHNPESEAAIGDL